MTLSPSWVMWNSNMNVMNLVNASQSSHLRSAKLVLADSLGFSHSCDPVFTLIVEILCGSSNISTIKVFEIFSRSQERVVLTLISSRFESFKNLEVNGWLNMWGMIISNNCRFVVEFWDSWVTTMWMSSLVNRNVVFIFLSDSVVISLSCSSSDLTNP